MRNRLLSIPGILLSCFIMAAIMTPQAIQAQETTDSNTFAPAAKPSGRITLTMGQGGFLLSASGGRGTLVVQHKTYVFELAGIGLGEFGGSKIICVGEVYHLNRIEDFAGAYVKFESGYAATKGAGEMWLKNTNGVVIRLRSKTKGLELTAGAEGVLIKLKTAKKN
jgi:hypothetical protein